MKAFIAGFIAGAAVLIFLAVEPDMRIHRRWE